MKNPSTQTHHIISIGNQFYLSMAKGPIYEPGDSKEISLIPGGGHLLLLNIQHEWSFYPFYSNEEFANFSKAVGDCFKSFETKMLMFEVTKPGPYQHGHVQMIPIPLRFEKDLISKFINEFETQGLKLVAEVSVENLEWHKEAYIRVDFGNEVYICSIQNNERFDIQICRKIVSEILGLPNRVDWRKSTLDHQAELEITKQFKHAFKSFDFTD